ncbi:3-deoxy-7-phosphoheptulonate synthase [Facklamia sp. DSM 111018]|uniref:3-deoxy-7-phosphoheptulonate synthase n=1 Tax=Facklamia lactis TaxID=2749967 RepID=A0ABS0LNM8_9LACT|nr:3-deoxy-7-phosphoheptulonate synthase [Facklamia lactis]MBG9979558.1 3-deoxy-7-phosphoheptulonate synthase [Facklamia lactis]MBG9985773.1 3-deoxy-7-phosphoheptulonate synthase [Facklamia lactis]
MPINPVQVKQVIFDGQQPVIIAGPCSIESEDHIYQEAHALKKAGVHMIRAGAYKPRTCPHDFQGLGFEAVKFLRQAADEVNLPMVTEVVSEYDIDLMADWVDMFQVGARNMYNYQLLKRLAKTGKPVLLKRGLSASLHEWEMAGLYLMTEGKAPVVYCERGIRSFQDQTRNTLDLAGAILMQTRTGQPVIIDPSHASGRRDLILPLTKASLAGGLAGVMIEVHHNPDQAWTDAAQIIDYPSLHQLMKECQPWIVSK